MSFKKIAPFILILGVSIAAFAGSPTKKSGDEAFALLTSALQKYVTSGLVDYPAIAKDADFKAFLKWLKTADPKTLPNNKAKMAFWVNAYNALAIQNVINSSKPAENEWIKSALDVTGFFSTRSQKVAGQKLTLNKLEKEVAFPQFNDARLHFAFVCAAMSCPLLPAMAYTADNFDTLIKQVAWEFLQNPRKNRLDKENKILYLSQIFNWYRPDFEKDGKSLVDFLLPYFDDATRVFLQKNKVEIKFLEYNWALNLKSKS